MQVRESLRLLVARFIEGLAAAIVGFTEELAAVVVGFIEELAIALGIHAGILHPLLNRWRGGAARKTAQYNQDDEPSHNISPANPC